MWGIFQRESQLLLFTVDVDQMGGGEAHWNFCKKSSRLGTIFKTTLKCPKCLTTDVFLGQSHVTCVVCVSSIPCCMLLSFSPGSFKHLYSEYSSGSVSGECERLLTSIIFCWCEKLCLYFLTALGMIQRRTNGPEWPPWAPGDWGLPLLSWEDFFMLLGGLMGHLR